MNSKNLQKFFLKSVASLLVLTFATHQLLYAADVRQMLVDAKLSFLEEEAKRNSLSSGELLESQSFQQQAVSTQQALEDINQNHFSLTTQNGDILDYIGSKLSKVTRQDGSMLKNITLDGQGLISKADLMLSDGSVQVYDNGKVIAYALPDGTQVFYENSQISKTIKDNVETSYTYTKDTQGSLLSTTLENVHNKSIYNSQNILIESINKDEGTKHVYEDGILKSILYADGIQIFFKLIPFNTDKKLLFDYQLDANNTQSLQTSKEIFQYQILRGDNSLKEILDHEGNRLFFDENSSLSRAINIRGDEILLSQVRSEYSNVVKSKITQGGITSSYDQSGVLQSIQYQDTTLFFKADKSISSIQKDDGTILSDLVFLNGSIKDAKITSPNGEIRLYQGGELYYLLNPDGSEIYYEDLKPIKLITPLKYNYDLNYTPQTIEATLKPEDVIKGDSLTAIKLSYDTSFNLKQAIRKNNEIINYLGNNISSIQTPSEEIKTFSYQKDSVGNVLSYTVTQGNTQSFYDNFNHLNKVLISDPQKVLEVMYQYDKIREVYKTPSTGQRALVFKYTYDADKTIIQDLEEGSVKTYQNELLLTSVDTNTSVLSTYEYQPVIPAEAGIQKVARVIVSRFNRVLHTYDYSYQNDLTVVKDEENIIRSYDSAKKLLYMDKAEKRYQYFYAKDASNKDIITEKLIQRTLSDGSRVTYNDQSAIDKIYLLTGEIIDNVILDSDLSFKTAKITKTDGTYKIFNSQKVVEEKTTASEILSYDEQGLVTKLIKASGEILNYTYQKDAFGNVQSIGLDLGDSILSYNAQGDLDNLKLKNVPLDIDNSTAFIDSVKYPITRYGDSRLKTQDAKFGRASGYFDGSGDKLGVQDSADWSFGSGNFTVDTWVKLDNLRANQVIFCQGSDGSNYNYLYWTGSGFRYSAFQGNGILVNFAITDTVPLNQWFHIALVRDGSNMKLYRDGILKNQTTYAGSLPDYTGSFTLGSLTAGGSDYGYYLSGYLDEFRISKGQARYSASFTPQTELYVPDDKTSLLLHFDGLDKSFFKYAVTKNASNVVTGSVLTGDGGIINLDAQGKYLNKTLSANVVDPANAFLLKINNNLSLYQKLSFMDKLNKQEQSVNNETLSYQMGILKNIVSSDNQTTAVEYVLKNNQTYTKLTKNNVSYVYDPTKSLSEITVLGKTYTYSLTRNADDTIASLVLTSSDEALTFDASLKLIKAYEFRSFDETRTLDFKDGVLLSITDNFGRKVDVDSAGKITNLKVKELELAVTNYVFNTTTALSFGTSSNVAISNPTAAVNVSGSYSKDTDGSVILKTIDLNADGFLDRVTTQSANPNVWKVQWGTGYSFLDPVDFGNVQFSSDAATKAMDYDFAGGVQKSALVDMNGDGKPDRLYINPADLSSYYVQYNNGISFDNAVLFKNVKSPSSTDYAWQAMGYKSQGVEFSRLIDFDGDGKTDRLYSSANNQTGWYFQKNNGASFDEPVVIGIYNIYAGDGIWGSLSASWTNGTYGTVVYTALMDLNGDKRPDRILGDASLGVKTWKVQWNNGSGFDAPVTWLMSDTDVAGYNAIMMIDYNMNMVDLVDLTGDGKLDRVHTNENFTTNNNKLYVDTNTGAGFSTSKTVTHVVHQTSTQSYNVQVANNGQRSNLSYGSVTPLQTSVADYLDMDSDGVLDYVYQSSGTNYKSLSIQKNNSAGTITLTNATFKEGATSAVVTNNVLATAFNTTLNKSKLEVLRSSLFRFHRNSAKDNQTKTDVLAKTALFKDLANDKFVMPIAKDIFNYNAKVSESKLDASEVLMQEYSADGSLQTQSKFDGTITLFENNKAKVVQNQKGEKLIEYSYDTQGNLSKVDLINARALLPSKIAETKKQIEEQRNKLVQDLLKTKNIATTSLLSQTSAQKTSLYAELTRLQDQYNQVSGISASGRAARSQRGDALNTIAHGMDDIRIAIASINKQEADSLSNLNTDVKTYSDQIEADANKALADLNTQDFALRQQILRQEISPIVYDNYRRILGRDPSSAEYDSWTAKVDFATGKLISGSTQTLSQAITATLNSSTELTDRQTYVNTIKNRITSKINNYLGLSQTDKTAFYSALGLSSSDVIALSNTDAQKVLGWLTTRSLHFGQSAFLSLESLLDQKGISYAREDLAEKAILIDILTGIISPLDDGDLVISMFALNKVAQSYGLVLSAATLSWEDLLKIYQLNPTARVVGHINGNHYIIITGITNNSITYVDPGIGKDKQNESLTVRKDGFLKAWQGNVILEQSKFQTLANYQSKTMTAQKSQSVRGAFWGSLLGMLGSIVMWIPGLNLLGFAINAISAIISGIEGDWISAISSIATLGMAPTGGVGSFFKNAFQGLTNSLGALGTAVNAVAGFTSNVYKAVSGFVSSVAGGIGGFLQGALGVSSKIASNIANTVVGIGVNFAVSKGFQSIGVNPQLASFLGSLSAGAVISKFSPVDASKGITQATNINQSIMRTINLTRIGNLGLELGLSPEITNIISLSVGAVSGNIIQNPGTTLAQAFTNVKPELFMSLAGYGIDKFQRGIGLDPVFSNLISIPLQLASNAVGNSLLGQQPIDLSSVINPTNLINGAIKLGFDMGVNNLNLPTYAKEFIQKFTQDIQINGKALTDLVSAGLKYVSKTANQVMGGNLIKNIIYAPAELKQMASGSTSANEFFKSTMNKFSDVISTETKEAYYKSETALSGSNVSVSGSVYTFRSDNTQLDYDAATDTLTDSYGTGLLKVQGLSSSYDGNYSFNTMTYKNLLEEGFALEQNYTNDGLNDWSFNYDGAILLKVDLHSKEIPVTVDDLYKGQFEFNAPAVVPMSTQDASGNVTSEAYLVPLKYSFAVGNDLKLNNGQAEIIKGTKHENLRLDKELYILTNGIANENYKIEGTPDYVINLQNDIISKGVDPQTKLPSVTTDDIVTAGTFYQSALEGLASNAISIYSLLQGKTPNQIITTLFERIFDAPIEDLKEDAMKKMQDIIYWMIEGASATSHAVLSNDISEKLDYYFDKNGQANRQRNTVAVGYSGGFVPLAETLASEDYDPNIDQGYNLKTLVALGAALINPKVIASKIIEKILEIAGLLKNPYEFASAHTEAAFMQLDQMLLVEYGPLPFPKFSQDFIDKYRYMTSEDAYKEFNKKMNSVNDYLSTLFPSFILDGLSNSKTDMIVNVYGTKDILRQLKIDGNAIGGYKDSIAGFSVNGTTKSLFNIEIVGATHYDYMRRGEKDFNMVDTQWNNAVADFVAGLVLNSKSNELLNQFLQDQKRQGFAEKENNKWVIRLTGYNLR